MITTTNRATARKSTKPESLRLKIRLPQGVTASQARAAFWKAFGNSPERVCAQCAKDAMSEATASATADAEARAKGYKRYSIPLGPAAVACLSEVPLDQRTGTKAATTAADLGLLVNPYLLSSQKRETMLILQDLESDSVEYVDVNIHWNACQHLLDYSEADQVAVLAPLVNRAIVSWYVEEGLMISVEDFLASEGVEASPTLVAKLKARVAGFEVFHAAVA
ncbi:hypothetical protein OpiT1DRAFT_04023 [Opitutaceae bacterium TAV1]|nr:hypothetical protein OpiT1DRAFT_04023 [Opitutaceae bacterium TAV1]